MVALATSDRFTLQPGIRVTGYCRGQFAFYGVSTVEKLLKRCSSNILYMYKILMLASLVN